MTRPALFAASGFLMILLGACNTIEGAGQDLSIAGQSLQQEAQRSSSPKPRPDIEPDIEPGDQSI